MSFDWLFRRTARRISTTSRPELRVEALEPRWTPAAHSYVVPGATGAQTSLEFTWTERVADYNSETGVYVVQDAAGRVGGLLPGDPGYAAAALSNAQIVFPSGAGAGEKKQLAFVAGDRLAFYIIQNDGTVHFRTRNAQNALAGGPLAFFSFDAANPDGFDHVQDRSLGDRTQRFAWEDWTGGGDRDFNDVVFTVGAASARAVPIPGLGGQTVPTDFTWLSRDAKSNNELGVFVTDDATGRVGGLTPGSPGYVNSVLSSPSRHVLFASGEGAGAKATVDLPGGGFFGLYLVSNGTSDQALAGHPVSGTASGPPVFFSFPAANTDGFDHLRWLSDTDFAWEDGLKGGDQDFNDLIGRVEFGTPQGQPGNSAPFIRAPIGAVSLAAAAKTTLDLAGNFDDVNITDSRVRFDTSSGPVNIELFDRQAPRTVANFFNYITDGKYTDSIFHRSAKQAGVPFVLQGGGFTFQDNPSRLDPIAADPAVQNEPDPINRSNIRGTIALAKKQGQPNSATDEFFFNLGDNSGNLNNQNGGFTVFGKLVGPADQQVVDTLAAIQTQNHGDPFTEIPLLGYAGSSFPTDTVRANYAFTGAGTVVSRTEQLTFSVVTNTNPAVVSTSVVHNRLTLQAGQAGAATLTVRATDLAGAFVDTTFTVTVS